MAKEQDWTPWYRRKEYKGNLTEEEKRHLDSFRLEEKHPAVAVEDLPEEVQGYLSELELAVYDAKQEGVATKAFVLTGIGALAIFLAYRELGWTLIEPVTSPPRDQVMRRLIPDSRSPSRFSHRISIER